MDKDYTILINRKHPLPEDFIPEHLVDIGLPFDAVPGEGLHCLIHLQR